MDLQSNRNSVLNAFRPYLRLLKAYNKENFHHCTNWRHAIHRVLDAICLTLLILAIPIVVTLGVWYLAENCADWKKAVTLLPLLFSLLQLTLTFAAMIIKNQTISKTVDQVQIVVNQRKFKIY